MVQLILLREYHDGSVTRATDLQPRVMRTINQLSPREEPRRPIPNKHMLSLTLLACLYCRGTDDLSVTATISPAMLINAKARLPKQQYPLFYGILIKP